jgi:hypothetical protein
MDLVFYLRKSPRSVQWLYYNIRGDRQGWEEIKLRQAKRYFRLIKSGDEIQDELERIKKEKYLYMSTQNISTKICIYGCGLNLYWNTAPNEYWEVFTKKKHVCPNRQQQSTHYIYNSNKTKLLQ